MNLRTELGDHEKYEAVTGLVRKNWPKREHMTHEIPILNKKP